MFYDFITKYIDFFAEEREKLSFSHLFIKNIGIFQILTLEIYKETLTNNIVRFEIPGPEKQKNIDKKVCSQAFPNLILISFLLLTEMDVCPFKNIWHL